MGWVRPKTRTGPYGRRRPLPIKGSSRRPFSLIGPAEPSDWPPRDSAEEPLDQDRVVVASAPNTEAEAAAGTDNLAVAQRHAPGGHIHRFPYPLVVAYDEDRAVLGSIPNPASFSDHDYTELMGRLESFDGFSLDWRLPPIRHLELERLRPNSVDGGELEGIAVRSYVHQLATMNVDEWEMMSGWLDEMAARAR